MSNEETQEKKQETTSDKSKESTDTKDAGEKGETIPAVEEAKKAALDLKTENTRREKLLAEEKKVLDRKESLNALGGGSPAGKEEKPTLTEAERASRKRIKDVGLAGGATWAKNMDKEDAN